MFYIKIDNPDRGKRLEDAVGMMGTPVEGSARVCLVTSFTSVVGSQKPEYAPDKQFAGEDYGFVHATLADGKSVDLPFAAKDFEALLLDAQKKNIIADFTGEHWPDRLHDYLAIRSATRLAIG